jgi:hypothetical protein
VISCRKGFRENHLNALIGDLSTIEDELSLFRTEAGVLVKGVAVKHTSAHTRANHDEMLRCRKGGGPEKRTG